MGLFRKKKITENEQVVLKKMENSQLLNYFISSMLSNSEAQWMKSRQPGDSGRRNVIVKPSGFIVEIPGAYEKRKTDSFVSFNFEESGYSDLNSQQCDGITIDTSRMCFLFATALRNRLQAVLTNCTFDTVTTDREMKDLGGGSDFLFFLDLFMTDIGKQASFTYSVPARGVSDLF